MRTTYSSTKTYGYRWMMGAVISVSLAACGQGWIWDGPDHGGPGSGTGGTIGASDGGYEDGGPIATGGTFGDGAVGTDGGGCTEVGTGGMFGDAGAGTGGGTFTGTGGAFEGGGSGGSAGVSCSTFSLDHDVLCEDVVDASQEAYADCLQRGLDLIEFPPITDCYPGARVRLSYTCCARPL